MPKVLIVLSAADKWTRADGSRYESGIWAQEFVDILPERINLGLVAFAGTASTLVPPTTDRDQVRGALSNLELAESTGITLIGFLRGDGCNVYSHTRRLVLPAQ